MTEIERKMMLGMINILNEASFAYYNGKPLLMTDSQFDMRLADLLELEQETGVVFSNSPTINVGAKVLDNLPEVIHNHPMLSLDKCHTAQEVVDFSSGKELIASIKCDGMTVSLLYEDGVLVRAESRGNGHSGNDITEHIKQFINVPLTINKQGTYIVDGEAVILDDDFAEINSNEEFKNSRNTVAGTLSSLDTSVVSQRKVRFIAWDVIEGGNGNSLKDNLAEASTLGFDVVPYWSAINLELKKLQNTLDYIFEFAADNGYPCDGIVFKFNNIEYGKSLGATSHHFKNGIAYKRKDDVHETELIDVEFTMGKTGVLTPTAVFKPVEIDGTIVERASVHNISILRELNLCIGDIIEVYKANQIIPQVKRNISAEQRQYIEAIEAPTIDRLEYCPICHGKTRFVTENNSTVLICTNDNCNGKLLAKMTHFVSKNAMNVDGLSESTLEKFIELGWLSSFEDIYNLKLHYYEMIDMDGFGEKSVTKLLDAIENSRKTTLDRFIYSLSIPDVGRSTAKTIAFRFRDFKDFITRATDFNWEELDGIGSQTDLKINEFIKSHINEIRELAKRLEFEEVDEVVTSNNLSGLTFVITGSLNQFANRDEAKEKIEQAGGKVSGSVSTRTSYLVNNDVTSTSGKNKKAIELNIPIISEEELIKMLN